MCNCIEDQRDKFMEGTDIIALMIEHSTLRAIHTLTGKLVGPYKTGQAVVYTHPHTKRSGEIVTKNVRTFIAHTHCPWCGTPYVGELQDKNFSVRLQASVERLMKETGLKDFISKTAKYSDLSESLLTEFFKAFQSVTLNHLQGKK